MVGRPRRARHDPARTSLSATTKDRKPIGVKRIIDRPTLATGQLYSKGHSCPSSLGSTASSAHTSSVITVEDNDEETATAHGDATRKVDAGLVFDSVNRSTTGSTDPNLPSHRTVGSAETVVEVVDIQPTSTSSFTLDPTLSTVATPATDPGVLDDGVALTLGSQPLARKEKGCSRDHCKGSEGKEGARQDVTYLSDEESVGELQPHHERPTAPPQSSTSVKCSSGNTRFSHACEPMMLSQPLHEESDKGESGDVEALAAQQPDPQRGEARSVHRTTCCFSSLGPTATEDSLQHTGTRTYPDKVTVLHSLHTAPILHASGLIDFFTYGIQAAMRHYSGHLNITTSAEDDGACGEMGGRAHTLLPDRETTCTAPPASPDGTLHWSTPPPYRNTFLEDSADESKCGATWAHCRDRAVSCSSSSSAAATYDSDVEGNGSLPLEDDKKPERREGCLLNPQHTSLFRPPRGATAARDPAERGTAVDGSWLATIEPTPSSTHSQKPSQVPGGSEQVVHQQRDNTAHVLFGEALQHAYQCEDAHRHLRRARLDKHREQLLRGVALLQGGSPSLCAALLGEMQSLHGHGGLCGTGSATSPTTPQKERRPVGASSLSRFATRVGAAPKRSTETMAQWASKAQEAQPVPVQQDGGANKDTTEALFTGSGEAWFSSSPMTTATPQMGSIPKHLLQVMPPAQAQRLRRPLNSFTEALLRHHRDSVMKQCAARRAEDQTIRARRIYEFPLLTQDVVRYASLLVCLRRQSSSGDGTAVSSAAASAGEPVGLLADSSNKESSSSASNGESPQSPTVAAAEPAASHSFGEEGTLLYLKYPAPLLRTTSFAVETVRLLKWLRTWKKSSLAASSGTGGTSGCASRGSTGNVSGCGSDNSSRISGKNGRKRVRVVVASPAPAPCAASSSSRTPTTTAEASLPNRSTVEYVCRQAPHAVDLHEAGVRQERRTAFLKLFGAAAVQAQADTPSPTTPAGSNAMAMHKKKDGSADAKEVVVHKPASCSAVSELSGRSAGVRHTSSTPVGATHGIDFPLGPLSRTSGRTQLKPSQLMRGSRAYQLYCHAWKHVVKSGITPISVAANVFSGSHAITGPPCLINPHDDNTGAAATSDKDTSWTNGTVSRVCAALPFFKEMREEARHTALGSAHNGSYYEDAFGNRLRSARLAKKEQEQRELLAARQRRRAKKKGYFHRDDDDTKNGGLSGRAADQRASGLLEAMLQSFATCGSDGLDAGRRRKRRRSADSSDDGSESEDTAKGARPRSSKECAALPCSSSPESSSRSSSSSSSSALTVSTEYDQDNEIAKDELTNIAVVSGPTGSGKTAAVYMAAQLLGFRVVEMNTSVRRCPKTVEHLLAELTRSYRLSGPRSGAAGGFNVEEELAKLKQQHAAMMKQAKARASAAEKETLLTKRGAVKGNHISAQAIEKFFSKGSGRAAVPSSETAGCNQKKDVAEQEPGVCIVDETHAPAAISTPSSPLPSLPQQQPAATPGAPTETDTLLLFEDADILLGDESAKSFYAAIRDLAHRSKVPIVVTVSSDPAPAQRYDTEPFLALLDQQLQPQQPRIVSTSLGSALQPTYWHLCNAAGINSTMAALDAEQQALQVETDSSNYAALTEIPVTTTAATRESGGTPSTVSDPGKNMSRSPASGTFAAALPTLFPYVGSGGGAGGSAAPATGSGTNGVVTGASQPVAPGGSGSTNTTAASAAARYTHMLLSATLVSNFFGSQTPFTVVGPLPPSALYAQLLAVGAVELDLLRFNGPTALSDDGDGAATLSSSSWQQELECMAAGLTVRDVGLFLRLAEQLRQHIFGAWNVVSDTTSASPPSSPSARQGLVSAVQCDAAHSTTTDIRYWLNKLQVLLLSLRTESDAAQVVELAEDELLPGAATRKRSQATISKTSSAALSAVYSGDDVTSDAHLIGARRAEHLLEADFQSRASLAASEWDSAHGRHLSNVTYNELHSTRYQHWFLDNHVHYIADIVEELATTDHLTTHVDYTTPPKVPTSPVAAAKTFRRGRSPSSLSSKQRYPCAKDSDITTAAIPEPAQRQQEVASACLTKSSNNGGGGGGGAGGGMHPAWRSFFVASGASRTSTSSTASPTLREALQENTRQQTLVGRGDFKAYRTALDAPPPPSLAIPSRYEWPPSVQELRKQARSQANLRPVELLLPYGAAGDYYSTTAKSASTLAPLSIHDPAEQTSALLGHETSLRYPMRCAKRESSAGDNGEEEGDVGRDLPTGALSTQEDRFNVFRRWWCRARKAGVLRDSVAGHPVGALEDLIGFGCLLTSSAASTRTATA